MSNLQKYISTEVGEMPVDWKRFCLEDISEFITKGATPTTYGFKWEESGIPFLRSECVSENGFIENGISFISEEANNAMNRSKVQSDDILISITGNVGRVAIYPKKYESGNINQHIARVRIIKDDIIDRLFIYFQVNQPNYRNYYNGIVTGAAYPQLSLKQIRETPVFVPPLEIQKRIASILSTYDDLIENNLKRIKLLEETAQNIYKEWFVNFRFPNFEHTEFDKGSGLPVGWEMKKLSELVILTMGQSPKSEFYNENKEGLPFHQGVTGYGHRFVSHSTYCSVVTRIAEEGDILFSVRAPVGRLNIAPERLIIGRGLSSIRNNRNCQSFQLYQLKNHFFQEDLIGGGSIFNSVTKNDLENQLMISPLNEVVDEFERIVKLIDEQIWKLNLHNQNLKEARDILLPRLMNRTIEV